MSREQGQGGAAPSFLGAGQKLQEANQTAEMEAQLLVTAAEELLNEFGIEETLAFSRLRDPKSGKPVDMTDQEVVTTKASVQVEVDGSTYFIRPVRFLTNDIAGEDIFLAFDKTKDADDLEIPAIDIVRIEVGDRPGEKPGLYTPSGFDIPMQVGQARGIIDDITRQERQERQDELDRQRRQREFEASAGEREKRTRREERWDKLKDIGAGAAILGLAAGVVTVVVGLGYEVVKSQHDKCGRGCAVEKFDHNPATNLKHGLVLGIGQSGSPLHTFEAAQNPLLGRDIVPELGTPDSDSGDNGNYGPNAAQTKATSPTDITHTRTIVLTTSGHPPHCETADVHFDSPKDGVIVETASDHPQDFTFYVGESAVKFCWNVNNERNANDDPWAVFQRVPASQMPAVTPATR